MNTEQVLESGKKWGLTAAFGLAAVTAACFGQLPLAGALALKAGFFGVSRSLREFSDHTSDIHLAGSSKNAALAVHALGIVSLLTLAPYAAPLAVMA